MMFFAIFSVVCDVIGILIGIAVVLLVGYELLHSKLYRLLSKRLLKKGIIIWNPDEPAKSSNNGNNTKPGPKSRKTVSLAISNFPYTQNARHCIKVINYLNRSSSGCTFFINPNNVDKLEENESDSAGDTSSSVVSGAAVLVRRMTNHELEVGCETYAKSGCTWFENPEQLKTDVSIAATYAIKNFAASNARLYRPRGPCFMQKVVGAAQASNLRTVYGDVVPISSCATLCAGVVIENMRPGSIVVLQDGPSLLRALRIIIPVAKEQKVTFCKISESMKNSATAPPTEYAHVV